MANAVFTSLYTMYRFLNAQSESADIDISFVKESFSSAWNSSWAQNWQHRWLPHAVFVKDKDAVDEVRDMSLSGLKEVQDMAIQLKRNACVHDMTWVWRVSLWVCMLSEYPNNYGWRVFECCSLFLAHELSLAYIGPRQARPGVTGAQGFGGCALGRRTT
jgi:hypothetical protein